VELLDGAEVLESLYEKVGQSVGDQRRDEIFRGLNCLPGTPSAQKPKITQAMMERLEETVDAATCQRILSSGLRRLNAEWFPGSPEEVPGVW
jgi:hypothetical protein